MSTTHCCSRSAEISSSSLSGKSFCSVPRSSSRGTKGGSTPQVTSQQRVSVRSRGRSSASHGCSASCSLRSCAVCAARRCSSAVRSLTWQASASPSSSAFSLRYSLSPMAGRGASSGAFFGGAARRRTSMAVCTCRWRARQSAVSLSQRRRVSGMSGASGSLISTQPTRSSRRSRASCSRSSASTCSRFIFTMGIYRFTTFSTMARTAASMRCSA